MAFGRSPKFKQDYLPGNFTAAQFLVIAIEAAKNLHWKIGYTCKTGFRAYTKYSFTSWGEEVKVEIEKDTARLKSECMGMQLMDWGKNRRNIKKLIREIDFIKENISEEALSQKQEALKSSFEDTVGNGPIQPPTITKDKITTLFSIFKPTQDYFITPLLIDLNIVLFIIMVLSGVSLLHPDAETLVRWGADFRPVTLDGQWWRLITNCFLHIGIMHLLVNMFALFYIGILLEPYLGRSRFLTVYLLTGITASITSIWWHPSTVSAGASGAIFGLYGVFLALLTTKFIEKAARRSLLVSIIIFVGYNLLNGLKGGVDNAAHIGGLAGGLIMGYVLIPSLKKPAETSLKYISIGVLTFLVFDLSLASYRYIPQNSKYATDQQVERKNINYNMGPLKEGENLKHDMDQYKQRMKDFVAMESMALQAYREPQNTSKEELLSEIKDRGMYYWNENIKLVKAVDTLNLPDIIHDRNKKLIKYCRLRLALYHLVYKAIEENTNQYKDSIVIYDHQIETLIRELKKK